LLNSGGSNADGTHRRSGCVLRQPQHENKKLLAKKSPHEAGFFVSFKTTLI
jgi:hypothetical protein